jgi:hypothetical protein
MESIPRLSRTWCGVWVVDKLPKLPHWIRLILTGTYNMFPIQINYFLNYILFLDEKYMSSLKHFSYTSILFLPDNPKFQVSHHVAIVTKFANRFRSIISFNSHSNSVRYVLECLPIVKWKMIAVTCLLRLNLTCHKETTETKSFKENTKVYQRQRLTAFQQWQLA